MVKQGLPGKTGHNCSMFPPREATPRVVTMPQGLILSPAGSEVPLHVGYSSAQTTANQTLSNCLLQPRSWALKDKAQGTNVKIQGDKDCQVDWLVD